MENNESTQQQSSELSDSKLAQSSRRPAQLATLNFLLKLLKRWPWLVWTGVWAFLLLITAIAIFSLTYTGGVQHKEPEPTPRAAENPAETSSQKGSPMPLLLLGAVALSCVAGSLVLAKRRLATSSQQPTKLRQRQRSSARGLTRRQQRKQLLQEPPPIPTPPEEPQPPVAPVPAETEPVVTVLPPEESHPLDAGEESLVEMMDIRKNRSLSSLLGDNFKES